MRFRRILIPLDESSLAERALIPALFPAKAISAKLLFVRAATPLTLNLDPKLYKRTIKLHQNEAERYRHSSQRRISSPLFDTKTQALVGRPVDSIISYAQEVSK